MKSEHNGANRYETNTGIEKKKRKEIADSVHDDGILQTNLVRTIEKEKFEVIAAEHRFI
ncbi:ParB/Srx family N-terminal domain-containing protein [Staphylococcus aureus]